MASAFSDVLLVPFGETPTVPILEAAEDLGRVSGLTARVSAERLSIPEDAYDVRRGQFQAPRLLQRLRHVRAGAWGADGGARSAPDGRAAAEGVGPTLLLGVATVDLYAPGLSFVFGQADVLGGVAVISLTRLYPAFYGRNHDLDTFRRRGAIEAVHEVGHLLGVHHCEDRHCVMFFSSTVADSDRKGPLFCAHCRTLADRAVARTPPSPPPLAAG